MRGQRRKSKSSDNKHLVESVRVEPYGKAVFAGHINSVQIYSSLAHSVTPLTPFATVPPLPSSFVERPELSEPIIRKLISTSGTTALTAIAGMFGVGKTISAIALCHDNRVRARFSDGIVWLNVGRETKVEEKDCVRQVANALNQKFAIYSKEAYRTLLADKSVLVVLDDIWNRDAVEPFLIASGCSRLLYTSRNKELANLLGAENYEIDVFDETLARNFLAASTGMVNEPLPEPYAFEILAECKGLALALAMIGASLRDKPAERWQYLLDDLRGAKLRSIKGRPSGYAHETLHAAVAVSVESLTPDQKAKYLRLAVTLEDMALRPPMLRALWGGNERDVDDLVCILVDRSLASRDGAGCIRVHDLQLDYVRCEYPDTTALGLLHRVLERSLHIVDSHPEQFASQMRGRLLAHSDQQGVAAFLNDLDSCVPLPRLRPLQPALEAADSATLRVLEGHTDAVTAVALSSDGKLAVSGSRDGTLRVWDLKGKQPVRVVQSQRDWVGHMFLSCDGTVAIFDCGDGTLEVWDPQGKQPPRVLKGHRDGILAMAISSDGKLAISGSRDRTLRVWDLQGKQPPRVLKGHRDGIVAVAISSDSKLAISGSHDRTLRVWDLQGKQPPRVLKGHRDAITAVAISSDGKLAISGSRGTLLVWGLENKQPSRVLKYVMDSEIDWVTSLALSSDNKLAISGCVEGALRVWDLQGKQPVRVLKGHSDEVNAVALSSDGNLAVSASRDETLRVWDLQGIHPTPVLKGHIAPGRLRALSSDGKLAITGFRGFLQVWDLQGKQPPRVFENCISAREVVALSSDGTIVSGFLGKTLQVRDLESKQQPCVLQGHNGVVSAVALSSDGKLAASGSIDGTLRVWDLRDKQPLHVLKGHSGVVSAVALSSDGKIAISGSRDGTLRVWDLWDRHPPRVLKTSHIGLVKVLALSSDGKLAVSISRDRTLYVWNLQDAVNVATFTCDARVLACAWRDHQIVAVDEKGQFHVLAWEE